MHGRKNIKLLSVTFISILPFFFVNMMEDAVDQRVVVVINRQNFARSARRWLFQALKRKRESSNGSLEFRN